MGSKGEAIAAVGLGTALAAGGIGLAGVLITGWSALLALLRPLLGALAGWVIGLTPMAAWVVAGASQVGITLSAPSLWQLGAFLGFVGMFFRSVQSNTNNSRSN